jgi:hypothetical protein
VRCGKSQPVATGGSSRLPEKDQHHAEGIEALAEAWASLDGKLDEFLAGRGGEDTEGDYHGYLSDAAELAKRLERRGYLIVHAPRDT